MGSERNSLPFSSSGTAQQSAGGNPNGDKAPASSVSGGCLRAARQGRAKTLKPLRDESTRETNSLWHLLKPCQKHQVLIRCGMAMEIEQTSSDLKGGEEATPCMFSGAPPIRLFTANLSDAV